MQFLRIKISVAHHNTMDTYWIQLCIVSILIYGLNGQSYRQCYTCEGTHCISPLGFTVSNCNSATDQCVTIYSGYTPVKRACYSALNTTEKAFCDDTTNLECSKCTTDSCNDLGRIDHTCITCSSIKNQTCLTSPKTLVATRCLAQQFSGNQSCYIKSDEETTQRGCIITEADLNTCVTNSTNECSLCSTTACNTYEFPVGRRKCYQDSELTYCANANDNCFAYNIYGMKQLCSSAVNESVRELCENNPYRCMECLDDACNTNVAFSINCRKCDSSATEINCVGTPAQSPIAACTDGCVTYIKTENGSLATTHRACYENLSTAQKTQCQSGTGLCEPCLDDDCNSKVFPADRKLCYQCDSAECSSATLTPTVCPFYSATDKCVSIMKNGQAVEFTCLSLLNRTQSCANTESCIVSECSENGCNNPTVFEKSTSCVQCSTKNDVECTTAPNKVGSIPCTNSVDTCYTMLQDGNVIRGCLTDLNTTQQTYCRTNCSLCGTIGGCNNQIYPPNRLFCHQCDSQVNSSCSQSISADPSMCLNYNAANKCIALLNKDGVYIRTCASNTDEICKDTVVCSTCDENGCNNAKISSPPDSDNGSGMVSVSIVMAVIFAIFLSILNVN